MHRKDQTSVKIAALLLPIAFLNSPFLSSPGIRPSAQFPAVFHDSPPVQIAIWNRRPRRPLGTRGTCPIAPGLLGKRLIWHERPLFLWQGRGVELRVRDRATSQVIWRQALEAAQESAVYSGTIPLQPGKLYQWQVTGRSDNWHTFDMMPTAQRQTIAAELQSLERQQQSMGASPEAIALKKAEFFADQELWSDALQTVFEVNNPSTAFVEQQEAYVRSLCTVSSATVSIEGK
jgi:hypothetical protein